MFTNSFFLLKNFFVNSFEDKLYKVSYSDIVMLSFHFIIKCKTLVIGFIQPGSLMAIKIQFLLLDGWKRMIMLFHAR